MVKLTRNEILVNCGFKFDLFKKMNFETGDSIRVKRILSMAIQNKDMVCIVGDRGVGKSTAIDIALMKMNARQVNVQSKDKERLRIAGIEKAMVIDLSEENPKRCQEIRARQLRRILGEASAKQDVVLVIEESHRLHGNTLRALKTLREMDWMGKRELFSVVLVGQSDPMAKRGVSEVRLRSDSVVMMGLTMDEVAGYIQSTVGRMFTDEAVNMVAEHSGTSNFLDLQALVVDLMGRSLAAGLDLVDGDVVARAMDIRREAMPRKSVARATKKTPADQARSGNDILKSVLATRSDAGISGNDMDKVVNG
ncbi:AAA family ATPase [Desulfobacter vibrioformis]|uniref:AAA family ATPase n=1 Tax=Desulfobacter vibrioformis TaxID=34031 RepID=UPI00068B4848|nr:AAA family ATPase [Desulfobacter vibrioformis]